MDIALITYNNGFNRIVKRLDTVSDYKNANYEKTHEDMLDFTNVNFNPNDGLNTEIVIGTAKPLDWLDHGPDYAVLHESDTVISRWFITGIKRERQGQYRISLRRDVLAEYRENVLSAPCYVEKGTIRDVKDPLLFNPEGMSYNQIKRKQIPLKDRTDMAWLVGYLDKNADSATTKTINYTYIDSSSYQYTDSDIDWDDCINYDDVDGAQEEAATKEAFTVKPQESRFLMRAVAPVYYYDPNSGDNYNNQYMNMEWDMEANQVSRGMGVAPFDWQGLNSIAMKIICGGGSLYPQQYYEWVDMWHVYAKGQNPTTAAAWKAMTNNVINDVLGTTSVLVSEDLDRDTYNGRTILHNGAVYRLEITYTEDESEAYLTGDNSYSAYFEAFRRSLREVKYLNGRNCYSIEDDDEPSKNKGKMVIKYKKYSIRARKIPTDDSFSFTLPTKTNRNTCPNAQYDMFAIPVTAAGLGFDVDGDDQHDTDFQLTVQEDNTDVVKHAYVNGISRMNLLIAQMLCTTLGEHVYDLQLLPYCPVDFVYFNGHNYTTHNFLNGEINRCYLDEMESTDYSAIMTNGGDIAGIIFWPKEPMFSKDITVEIPNVHIEDRVYAIDNPVLVYNNSNHLGDPIWRLEFPYQAEGTVSTDDLVLPTQIEANWMSLSISAASGKPVLYFTTDQLPQDPTPSQQVVLDGKQITLKANWVMNDSAEDLKVRNECEFQRLVSPNFNGIFEFKTSKMTGGLHNINVDCLYKPYSPYIKMNPDFSFLYGKDFNDSTGLILGGDFSLPTVKDAFIEYELQNKNYQAIFARGIENMDVNNQIARDKMIFNGVMGTMTATGAGAVTGLKKGGVPGALAGAAVGGGLTAITTAANMSFLERSQEEARDFAIDNFNYQMGNVKAMPQSISKSTPLTYNNTVWPILEEYDSTDEEKELLRNKLRYDGMTIMKVARLSDYEAEGGYLKGKLIRLDIDANSQVANQIYQEVDKGFYTE